MLYCYCYCSNHLLNTHQNLLTDPVSGYLKALEHRNSVPRPKGFCEANKVKSFAVLWQNLKCCYSHIIDTILFYESILFICIVDKLLITL